MGAFDLLNIASSGLGMHQTWLDALGSNISNVNTARRTSEQAFTPQMVVAQARADGGVRVASIASGDPEGILVHNPGHALADADGYVRMPAIDMASEMSQLIMAQRGFQASSQVTKFAQETYGSALQIGKS